MTAPRQRSCQRCSELADRCECPTFAGEEHMVCERCGALWGDHLLNFAHPDAESVCPPDVGPDKVPCNADTPHEPHLWTFDDDYPLMSCPGISVDEALAWGWADADA